MKKKKIFKETSAVPAVEWIRQLAEESAAFEVSKVVDREAGRGQRIHKMEWEYVITLSLNSDNRTIDVFVHSRQQLSPQTVLGVFPRLKWVPPDGILLICAPYISPRVAELCKEQNVSYLDGVGNCRIAAPGLFVQVSGQPNRQAAKQVTVDPFSKKSSRIVRTFLRHPDRGWQVQQLSQEADVSIGLVSKVKNALLEEAYLEERDRLLYLRDPGKLLQDWVAQYRPHVRRLQLFTIARPSETETRLAEWCRANGIPYAITQLSAAWRYTPMVRYDKSVVYIDKKVDTEANLRSLLHHLDARNVDTGVNCTLWITDDPGVFSDAREFEGVNIVSPLQLYLDLKVLAGRGEDVAQEILEKELPALLPDARHLDEQLRGGKK